MSCWVRLCTREGATGWPPGPSPEDKKNVVKRLDHFVFRRHLNLTFELLSVDLYHFIKMNNFMGFSLTLIKRMAIQILVSLYYMQ